MAVFSVNLSSLFHFILATYVSAVFVNGAAGTVYSNGFLHTQMLWGYVISLILGEYDCSESSKLGTFRPGSLNNLTPKVLITT